MRSALVLRSVARSSVAASTRRYADHVGGKFGDRERAQEQQAVRRHEQELLDKMKSDRRRSQASAPASGAAVDEDNLKGGVYTFSGEEVLSVDEFLQFRKAFMGRLSRLEAEVAELKQQLNK